MDAALGVVAFIWYCLLNGVLSQVREQMFHCSNNDHLEAANRWIAGDCANPELHTFYKECTLPYSGEQWHCFRCSCYFFSPSSLLLYDQAKSACEALQARLIIIESADENAGVLDIIDTNGYTPVRNSLFLKSYYLGWYDEVWQDGREAVYTNFATYTPLLGKCAAMGIGAPYGKWHTRSCITTKHAYICEIEF